ncbi:MAG: MarR family winged helix-turn-helix transcriptional regulator [Micromonosporaceae bacterium]
MHEEGHGSTYGVPQALGRLRVALDDAYQRASRDLGLTAQQAELLCAAMRPAAVGDLAAALRCDRSNVTRLVDRAAAHDLVRRRQGHDKRVSMIELSPKGQRLARRFIALLEAQTAELRASWSDGRKRQATELLDEISAALLPAGAPHPSP